MEKVLYLHYGSVKDAFGYERTIRDKKKNIHIHGQKIEPGQNNGSREG